MKFGTTTIPIAGWIINSSNPDGMRQKRLEAIRKIVTGYGMDAVEMSLDLGMVYPEVLTIIFTSQRLVCRESLVLAVRFTCRSCGWTAQA